MRNFSPSFFALSIFLSFAPTWLPGDVNPRAVNSREAKQFPAASNDAKQEKAEPKKTATKGIYSPKKLEVQTPAAAQAPAPSFVHKFEPFTGKVTKNKVRLRLQPNYEGAALRELNRGDLVSVLGENDEFYAVQPPVDFRGYVFRTYILDNVVEGDRVNIRIKADKDAPLLGQLKAGDRVEGVISPESNKWLEIKLPKSVRFFIAKEYVEKAGDAGYKERLDRKRIAAFDLLNTTDAMSKDEMQKPFEQMSIAGIRANYEHIINDFPEFPEAAAKAKESAAAIQEAYNAKKLAYLEEQSRLSASTMESNKQLSKELQAQKSQINRLVEEIGQNRQQAAYPQFPMNGPEIQKKPSQLPVNMSNWLPVEENLFNQWAQASGQRSLSEFYDDQKKQSFILTGIIDSYTRPVRNKPGDYMLLNPVSRLPIAFLYSTMVNLQDLVGHQVSIKVSPRSDNNFAFPAYFVLEVE